MTANLKRYVLGERVTEWPAGSWNRIADAVERVLPNEPPIERGGATQNVIPVKNTSTTDIPKGGVMMPTGSLLDIADGDRTANYAAMLEVDVPTLANGAESTYMIAVSGVDRGVIGSGVLMGPVWSRVNVRDTSDKYAQVIDADATMLESTASGSRARIIAKEPGLGEVWALILLAPYRLRIRKGVTQGTITGGGSGTVDIYQNGTDVLEDNFVSLDWLHGGEDIDPGINVIAVDFEDENIFTIIVSDCNPEPAPAPPGSGDAITASTTQTQLEGQLNYRVNHVTVCANANDTVTLIAAVQGEDIYIKNSGAQTLQIFPFTSDKIDGGSVDASVTLAAGASVHYFAVTNTEWLS